MTDLEREIQRFKEKTNQMEAWAVFQAICQILVLIVPGFICPFSQSTSTPTIEEMTAQVNQWETLYVTP